MATSFTCSSSSGLQINSCMIILFLCCSLFFFALSESVYFEILKNSADPTNMVYSGDAVASSGDIEFNQFGDGIGVGLARYADAIQIWDKKSGKLSDFTTHFTFIMNTRHTLQSDGFAFFLAPVGFEIPLNSNGSFLGLFNTTTNDSPESQMIFIEFDTSANEWDVPFPHVAINRNSISHSVNYTFWNATLHSGHSADAWIAYHSSTKMLCLTWRYSAENTSRDATSLSYKVDLREALPDMVTIGFSGASSSFGERHVLRYWEFNSTLNIVGESEDISNKRKLAVGLTVPLVILVVGGLVYVTSILYWRRQRKFSQKSLDTIALTSISDIDLEGGAGPKRFSYNDLTLATNNFSEDRKLGEGGFGCVYKGYLSREGVVVAVKKISQTSKQGKKEYLAEVKIISILRHRNLVQLIGWCHDQTQFLLVYEYLPNGSLDTHLFRKKTTLE